MELQTLYLASPREASMKKKSFESKTVKFFIVCSPPSRGPAFQTSAFSGFSLSGRSLGSEPNLSPFHRVLICGTHVLPQLRCFWDMFRAKLADESPYTASIGGMRLKLAELQESDAEAQKIRTEELKKSLDEYVDVDGVLHHQGLPFVPEIIRTELISRHHDDPLAGHFGIDKTRELIGRKYYWPSLRKDVEAYVKGCDF